MTKKERKASVLRRKSLVQPEVNNPFSHSLHLGKLQKLEIAIGTVLLFPIRLVLLVLIFLLGSFLAWLATPSCSAKRDEEPEPYSNCRSFFFKPVRLCVRGILFVMGFHWISVKGKIASPKEAAIIVAAPHSSFIDVMSFAVLGHLSGVSRIENDSIPIAGSIIRSTQPIYVSRSDINSRKSTINEIKRRANSGGKWPQVVIFPEGTCTNRKCLITFKAGAFYPGTPVQPVVIRYRNKLDSYTWTMSGPGMLKLLWLTMSQFHNRLELELLPVYKPDTEEIHDPKLFARNVQMEMAKCLGVPYTDHSYEDCRLMIEAEKSLLPATTGIVEYQKISTKLGLNLDSMKEVLSTFAEIDQNADGLVDLCEFAHYLKLPITPKIEEIFSLYDRSDSGFIDFREYMIGHALLSRPANSDETIKLAFEVFDVDKDGRICEGELKHILQGAFPCITDLEVTCLFKQADKKHKGSLSYEEFREFALLRPEYALLFQRHQNEATSDNINELSENDDSDHDEVFQKREVCA